jgi:hypothetical protein
VRCRREMGRLGYTGQRCAGAGGIDAVATGSSAAQVAVVARNMAARESSSGFRGLVVMVSSSYTRPQTGRRTLKPTAPCERPSPGCRWGPVDAFSSTTAATRTFVTCTYRREVHGARIRLPQ